MAEPRIAKAAAMALWRLSRDGPEYLFIRRNFTDPSRIPKRYGGLYDFPGGKKEQGEKPMMTALRELEEETGYAGGVEEISELALSSKLRMPHPMLPVFYGRAGKPNALLHPDLNEVMDARWMTRNGYVSLLNSEEWKNEYMKEVCRQGLNNPKFGRYAITEAAIPRTANHALECIDNILRRRLEYLGHPLEQGVVTNNAR